MSEPGAATRMRLGLAALAVLLGFAPPALAQLRRPKADIAPVVERERVPAGSEGRALLQVSLPEGFHVQSNRPRDPSLIPTELTVAPPEGITVTEIVFPPSTDLKQAGSDQPLAVFERAFTIGIRFAVARTAAPGDVTLPFRLRYQACDASVCYAPATAEAAWSFRVVGPGEAAGPALHRELFAQVAFGHGEAPAAAPTAPTRPALEAASAAPADLQHELDSFTVLATTGGYLGTADFLRFVHDAESGAKPRSWFEGRGPLAILLIVFLGGLALNLTPCVLPMIPINLAIIGAGSRAGSRGRGFLLGTAYGAAMALVYGAIGVIVILTAGTFGTINSSPWFNLAIAALFVVLGLAMFDVVAIDFSRFSGGVRAGQPSGGTLALAFGMGAVAALLAGACVAPVVIQVVLFSSSLYAAGTKAALALPFLLGAGMALPWPLAGAGLSALPKPGAWMVRVKQALGVVILATAAYYGYLGYELLSNRWVDAGAVASSVEEKIKEGWHASLAEGLSAAKREGKPVLIDMWATWCKNCLTMDKTTLADERVKAALQGYIKVKFQAEEPDRPPARDVMRRFEAVGLPTYVILKPTT